METTKEQIKKCVQDSQEHFFNLGVAHYEISLLEKKRQEFEIKACNAKANLEALNDVAAKLRAQADKEKADGKAL